DAGSLVWDPNTPPSATVNQAVVITGTNFSPNAVAWVSLPCDSLGFRKALSTARNSSTQIVATIPIRCAGTYSLEVENPQPGGGLSAQIAMTARRESASTAAELSTAATLFVMNPVPVIASLDTGSLVWDPQRATFNQAVVITGTNFSLNAVAWVSLPCDTLGFRKALSTVRSSSTQIVATIPISCAGTYSLEVENPQPGGGLSAPVSLIVPPASAMAAVEQR